MRSLNSHVSVPLVYVHLVLQKQGSAPSQALEKHYTDRPERHEANRNLEEAALVLLDFSCLIEVQMYLLGAHLKTLSFLPLS